MTMLTLFGCAPTEEEKKQAEEEEKNKPSISIQPVSALTEPDEGLASYLAIISMSKAIEDNVTVHYSLNPKTATAGDDFQAQSGVLTIPSGSTSATIELIILADNLDEQDEEFTITLSSPTNAKLGVDTETVVIQDSILDVKPIISIQPVAPLQEPDEGSTTYSATVTLSTITSLPVSLAYSFHSGTAESGDDFDGTAGVLEIAPGSDSAVIDVTINSDEVDELVDEDFSIKLSSLINATPGVISQTVVIIDSVLDVTPVISIEPIAPLQEPSSDSITYLAVIKLSSVTSFPVSVDYSLDSGSAIAGSDFDVLSGHLDFPPGTNSAEIELVINADDIDEFDENFTITLSNLINSKMDDATVTVTIIDSAEDVAIVSFASDNARVPENAGEYKVKLKLSSASEKEINIPFTMSGIATENQDFILLTKNPIVVPLNETETDIVIKFVPDMIPEGGESLIIQLGTPINAELGELNKFVFTIAADVTLNDTGIVTWYNGLDFSDTSPTSLYPGQDADFGRDTKNNDQADGSDGFSFTNLDHSGNVLQPEDPSARCVQDNRTGLVFELKQPQQFLPTTGGETLRKELQDGLDAENVLYAFAHQNWRASNFQYYWYNDVDETNGGHSGATGGEFVIPTYPVSSACAFPNENMSSYNSNNTSCNTQVYANALNSTSLCGFKDWDLPTIEQLRTIHNYRDTTAQLNGTEFFPNTEVEYYISATPSADGDGAIWCMSGSTGQVALCNKNLPNYVRMVRGGAQ